MTEPVVELQSGFVRGVVEKHQEGFNYFAFKGIPYAEPPIGELRFKDPSPMKKWIGVIDCKNYGPPCLQQDYFTKLTSYSEDCLYLNVFSRSVDEINRNDPVIVVIHGGLFAIGSGCDMWCGPDYLIRKNVVLVTFNYRLGVLGFLNLEDEIAPGNQGLKDQIMVLQWVQQNIRVFGGNSDNVTLMGLSAGGIAAQCLALSPLTKGLIHKIISHSNALCNTWAWVYNGKPNAIALCSLLGRELVDSEKILKFLKTVDTKNLLEAQDRLRISLNAVVFGPGVDSKSPNPVMPVHPDILANQGIHLPCLAGYNAREGMMGTLGMSRDDFYEICDKDFKYMLIYNAKDILSRYKLSEKQVKRLYYKNDAVSQKSIESFINYVSDFYFVEGIHRFSRVQVEQSSAATYLFVFSYYLSSHSIANFILQNVPVKECTHLDDLPFLFKMRVFDMLGVQNFKERTKQYQIMEQMTEMWTNFARYGRPTVGTSELLPVHWLPITDGTVLRYLNIDEDITMQSTINVDQKLLSAKNIKV